MDEDEIAFASALGLDIATLRQDTMEQFPATSSFASPQRRRANGRRELAGAQTPTTLGRTFPSVSSPALAGATSPSVTRTERASTPEVLPRIVHSTRNAVGGGSPSPHPNRPPLVRSATLTPTRTVPQPKEQALINLKSAWIERVDSPKQAAKPSKLDTRKRPALDAHSDEDDDLGCSEYILSPDLRLKVMYGAEVVRIKPKEEDTEVPAASGSSKWPPQSPMVPKRVLQLGNGGSTTFLSPQSTSIGPSPSKSVQFAPVESPATHGSARFSADSPMKPSPSLMLHSHNKPLSITMPSQAVDLDAMYTQSNMSTVVNAMAMRSEYSFVDPSDFVTSRAVSNANPLLESVRGKKAQAAAWKTGFSTSRPLLQGVQHLFPSPSKPGDKFAGTGDQSGPGVGGDVLLWEREQSSKFAERPILKSLHVKFPSGPPAPTDKPATPSQTDLRTLMHDRRAYEDPTVTSPLPSWTAQSPTGYSPRQSMKALAVSRSGEFGLTAQEAAGPKPVPTKLARTFGLINSPGQPLLATGSPSQFSRRYGDYDDEGTSDGARTPSTATGKSSRSPSKKGKKSPTKKLNRKVLQHEVNDASAASRRYGDGSDSDSGLSTGRSSRGTFRKGATPTARELKAWQNTLDRNDVLVLKTKAAILIQKLFRGWRVRAEFVELMRPLIVVQHPYRDGINFRSWRFALITLSANRIIRAQRYAWGVRAARKARALAWALHIKSANDIQRAYRGYLGRIIAKQRRMERDAMLATRIQCGYRSWVATKRVAKLLLRRKRWGEIRTRAAILIQTVFRGSLQRLRLRWQQWAARVIQHAWKVRQWKRNWAALQIQRIWRGHAGWMWLKNRCAMDITRVARGFIARVGNRQERQRLHDDEQQRWAAEAHAVEVAGDVAVKEILEYLAAGKGREEVEAGAVLLQNRARVLSTQRKEDNWQAQLRDLFVLFDVDQRGALDEDQLAMLLQEMCIPVTPDELHTAVTDMDQDGNGLIELAEFTQYFASLGFRDPDDMGGDDEIPDASDSDDDAAAAAGSRKNMRAKMAKMKLQLKAQKLKNEFFGTVYRKLAERSIVNKAKEAARRIARKNFRRKFPPRYFCTKCIKTFIFERQLVAHWRAGCSPLDMKS